MLREERLRFILQKLQQQHRVTSKALSEELSVSDDTIRRDLNELAEGGHLKKVHGGAVPKPATPLAYAERIDFAHAGKRRLAEKSLPFFEDGMVIILDDGTTNLMLAKMLPFELKATIFTNGLHIAEALLEHPGVELILLGGKVRKQERSIIDPEVVHMLENVRADLCSIGASGVHHKIGVSATYRDELYTKRKMVEVSDKNIMLATNDKVNTARNYVVCKYPSLDALIVEDDIKPEILVDYLDQGVEVIL
ncbi:MAG: DeoR/GlpR family DNA-binding transcription regulator [Bacteroidota bacterium]